MAEGFDSFNAPQFFDFSKDLHKDENVDSYFEIDHENVQAPDPSQDPLRLRNSDEFQDDDVFYSPLKAIPRNNNYEEDYKEKPRRSMSVGDLKLLNEVRTDKKIIDIVREDTSISKIVKQATRYSSSSNLNKAESVSSLNKKKTWKKSAPSLNIVASKDNLDRLAQPKKSRSVQNLEQIAYVSTAEAERKFHFGTPTRFRSRPKISAVTNKLTIPQSPALLSKHRHRPIQAVSREERERLEYEEAQKFKIKANPLNKKILQGPIKPLVPMQKKPATVIEPFKITAVSRKVVEPPKKTFEFHAKPAPKVVIEPPKLEIKKISRPKPQSPDKPKPAVKLSKTIPVPFSFESRDQQIEKRKEQLMKRVVEEERKAREFHARPVPKFVLNSAKSSSTCTDRIGSDPGSIHREYSKSDENISTQFKARSPTVLYTKPFEPRKERHLIEINEFQLNTEKRAKEREEFEQRKRDKEGNIAQVKQLEEDLRLAKEEKEVARLRKEAQHKAQPIKKYKEIIIQPSGKVTEPMSPNFHRLRTKENKENSN